MRRLMVVSAVLLASACGKSEPPPKSDADAAAPAIDLAGLAGTWNATVTLEGTDSVIVQFTIDAAGDPAAWTMNLPDRAPLPMAVEVSGDSLLTTVGPYESVLRPGLAVEVRSAVHLVNGVLEGPTIAHYATASADSSVRMWLTATRSP